MRFKIAMCLNTSLFFFIYQRFIHQRFIYQRFAPTEHLANKPFAYEFCNLK
jgi:hypothetical protein